MEIDKPPDFPDGSENELPTVETDWYPSASELMKGVVLGQMPGDSDLTPPTHPENRTPSGRFRRLLSRRDRD